MWWITIILDIILIIIGFVFCSMYYNKNYGDPIKRMMLNVLEEHNVLYGNTFEAMPNFSNYSFNILLKGIITIVCILVVHFTDSLWITNLYVPYLLLTWWVYKKRVQQYRAENGIQKDVIRPSFVASLSLPVFHSIFLALLHVTYLLNA